MHLLCACVCYVPVCRPCFTFSVISQDNNSMQDMSGKFSQVNFFLQVFAITMVVK